MSPPGVRGLPQIMEYLPGLCSAAAAVGVGLCRLLIQLPPGRVGDGQGLIPPYTSPAPDRARWCRPKWAQSYSPWPSFLPGAFEFGLPLSQAEEFPQGGKR